MVPFANPQDDTNALRIVLASGSIALPSVVFANDVTKGLYWDTSGLHLTGLATPTNTGDAANKAYVDAQIGGTETTIQADSNPALDGAVTLASGTNVTLAQTGHTITVNATVPTLPSVVTSSTTVGGAALESVTVAGLLTTSTIWAVTQITTGGANLPLLSWTNTTNGHLNIIYSADMGSGAIVRVVFVP
jgi:hypothetical protein